MAMQLGDYLRLSEEERGRYAKACQVRTEMDDASFDKEKQALLIVTTVALGILLFFPLSFTTQLVVGKTWAWGAKVFSGHVVGIVGYKVNQWLESHYHHLTLLTAARELGFREVIVLDNA